MFIQAAPPARTKTRPAASNALPADTPCPALRTPSSAARFPPSGRQVETQLPGALLTISSTGPASEANGSTPLITIGGYASSANLLRSNILVCKAVVHVVDTVLLVSKKKEGRSLGKGRSSYPQGGAASAGAAHPSAPLAMPRDDRSSALAAPRPVQPVPCHVPTLLTRLPSWLALRLQPSSPLSTIVPYSVALEGLSPRTAQPAAAAAAAAPGVESAPAPVPAGEAAIRAALVQQRQEQEAERKAQSVALASAPAVEAASQQGTLTALSANTSLAGGTTAARFTAANCPSNPLIALQLHNDTGAFAKLLQAAAVPWLEDPTADVTVLAPTDLAMQASWGEGVAWGWHASSIANDTSCACRLALLPT